jgi:hypothetical protein
LANAPRTALLKLRFAEFHAGGVQGIDEFEHLPLPADELGAGLPAAAVLIGQVTQRREVLGGGREVAWPAVAAIGEDGALVQGAAAAVAAGLATLAPQGVERARQERFPAEAGFEQAGQAQLRLEQLRPESAKALVHEEPRVYL